MIVSLLVFVTIVVLALPSAVVFFPFTLLTGNVDPLYAAGCWIARIAIRVAGIRLRIEGREHIPARPRLHLHGQPRLQPRCAGAHVASSRPHCRSSSSARS